jgi:hypothetical protein
MNQNGCFGSLAVETACPNRDQHFLFRHSRNARVTARPPTRANQLRLHRSIAYIPNLGRDIGLCHRFHDVPDYFVATNSRKPKSPDAHKRPRLSFPFPFLAHRRLRPVRLALAHFLTKRWPRFSISYLHQTLDFPTGNEFLKLNFKLKGTL